MFEPKTQVFKLELIDKLKQNLGTNPFELKRKFFILNKIDTMNKESANACLKILEDCPNFAHFILIASNHENVLDTIRSRSIHLPFHPLSNLREYFPTLSDLQIKAMRGCIGNKELVTKNDLKFVYSEIVNLVENFSSISYADLIEWSVAKEEYDISFLTDIFLIACEDLYKEERNQFVNEVILFELKNFKDKLILNVNYKTHFRNALFQAKRNITKLN